jgi:hypothetical protein
MPTALIFSPDLDGHRQVYVFVIVDVLQELGFKIVVAGNKKQRTSNSFYVDKLKKKPEVTIIDTSNYTDGGLEISFLEFLELQNRYKADLTIFPEADNHFPLFISQVFRKKNRLRGKVVGIFMRPFYYYRENFFLDKLRFLKHFPSRWKNDEQLFYEFFLKQFSLLDVALSIDENFVSHHPYFNWLPDVFQQYAELIVHDEKPEQRIWIERLNEFKEKNSQRFPVLYFGTAQKRRGYDTLLKLAQESESCFIHCGLKDDRVKFDYDTNEIRSQLEKEGRLFETNQYIEDSLCIEYFFKSVTHLILPYEIFFGSSGIMLQALNFGIPVLSSENGIIGHRIKKYSLGKTYVENGFASLKNGFDSYKKLDPHRFEDDIKSYMDFQTPDQLKKVLINSFTANEIPVRVPF